MRSGLPNSGYGTHLPIDGYRCSIALEAFVSAGVISEADAVHTSPAVDPRFLRFFSCEVVRNNGLKLSVAP